MEPDEKAIGEMNSNLLKSTNILHMYKMPNVMICTPDQQLKKCKTRMCLKARRHNASVMALKGTSRKGNW
ncbi:hypothetical protein A6R68_07627 [Neotoma lepida]|uniref:Uncharacterized protein n=1 Tax=Neotoma lepida TaxID=56216 RepID=A0A1A6GDK6_NEOLE|nr:hypothetical protein A6R68_07627 [Neotoma lepida]